MYAAEKVKNPIKTEPKSSKNTIQRKVGMEFEMSGKHQCIVNENGSPSNLHGYDLYKGTGFKIVGDMGNIEFVTNAVDERTPEGIETLMRYCNNAATAYNSFIPKITSNEACKKRGRDYYKITKKLYRDNYKLYISNFASVAHPQATVGIKLDKLDDFITRYSNVLNASKKNYNRGENKFFIKNLRQDQLRLPIGGSRTKLKTEQKNIIIGSKIDAINHNAVNGLSLEAKGLLRLLGIMAKSYKAHYNKNHIIPTNAKSVMPIISRTALVDIYMRLTNVEQDLFKHCDTTILNYIDNQNDATQIILAGGSNMDPNVTGKSTVTYQQWADSLPASSNPPVVQDRNFWINTSSPSFSSIDTGMDGISNKAIQTPTEAEKQRNEDFGVARSTQLYDTNLNDEQGIIMELRALQRNVEPKDWKFVARDVAKLVNIANNNSLVQHQQHQRNQNVPILPNIVPAAVNQNIPGQQVIPHPRAGQLPVLNVPSRRARALVNHNARMVRGRSVVGNPGYVGNAFH